MKTFKVEIKPNYMVVRFDHGSGTIALTLFLPATRESFGHFAEAVIETAQVTGYAASRTEAALLLDRVLKCTEQSGLCWDDSVKMSNEDPISIDI